MKHIKAFVKKNIPEHYVNSEQIELNDFLILQSEYNNDIINLAKVISKALYDYNSNYIIKYFIDVLNDIENDYYKETLYYDNRNKQYFTRSFSSKPIKYNIIYKNKNEFEAIDKYEELLKIIENTKKYNL